MRLERNEIPNIPPEQMPEYLAKLPQVPAIHESQLLRMLGRPIMQTRGNRMLLDRFHAVAKSLPSVQYTGESLYLSRDDFTTAFTTLFSQDPVDSDSSLKEPAQSLPPAVRPKKEYPPNPFLEVVRRRIKSNESTHNFVPVVEGVKQGRESTIEAFCELVRKRALITLLSMGGNRDYEDMIQDVLVRAFTKIETFTSDEDHFDTRFLAWVSTIARNIFLQDIRRKKIIRFSSIEQREENKGEDTDITFAMDSWDAQVDIADLRSVLLSNLKPRNRELLLLSANGYTYEEIAAMKGLPLPTVRARIFHAREKLKGAYDQSKDH